MIVRTAMRTVEDRFFHPQACWACCQYTSRRHAGNKDSTSSRCFSSSTCPFATLGISQNSSLGAVKAAYRAKCRTHHPDFGGSELGFCAIKEAYEECASRMRERSKKCHGTFSRKGVHGPAPEPEEEAENGKFWRQSDAWYESHAKCLQKQRKMFYSAFPYAKTIDEMDELFRRLWIVTGSSPIDPGEPLVLALKHYHVVTGHGGQHLHSCFTTIDQWGKSLLYLGQGLPCIIFCCCCSTLMALRGG
ncbi:chaperone DnaJ protein [Trypanosoma rangeli]|uniref:Chaperone DnaJ protein n=1 Tax=Trypanosoma rangeli TaxID=5698 RepID=A0A422NLM8_TRYRA|nr:chaperone DnaJ protein [Trypanosoma rangeli]RNF06410.1 chaperone DnaJ protein [Trypanosoma rangeli]|eukprot:RNF06410.1 chaperone DnaJ protein [Trypanosoma rangeli]